MTDLSTPEMQRIFKSVRRLDISLYIIMCLIMLSGIGLAVVGLTRVVGYANKMDWAQILYIVMLAATFVYSVIVLILNIRIRKPYREALLQYVADGFSGQAQVLEGGKNVEISIYLIGDRLAVAKQGAEDLIYFDLSSVKKYYNVCANVTSLVKKYLTAYYFANCTDGGYYSVVITDAINKKPKIIKVVEDGAPVKDCSKNKYIISGIIPYAKTENA